MPISEQDGINYFKVECEQCGTQVNNDDDDTIYSEKLDKWFCSAYCEDIYCLENL
jgi:endogenous inhibitor of DNA gyrase (YacG/DUF329 family)